MTTYATSTAQPTLPNPAPPAPRHSQQPAHPPATRRPRAGIIIAATAFAITAAATTITAWQLAQPRAAAQNIVTVVRRHRLSTPPPTSKPPKQPPAPHGTNQLEESPPPVSSERRLLQQRVGRALRPTSPNGREAHHALGDRLLENAISARYAD